MAADVAIRTGRPEFDELFPRVRSFLDQDALDLRIDGQRIRGYRSPDSRAVWIRDHGDMMRAFRHFEPDLTSAVQHFADTQAASGRIFDYVTDDASCILEREPMNRLVAENELMMYAHDGFWQCMDTVRDLALLQGLWDAGKAPWRLWRDG